MIGIKQLQKNKNALLKKIYLNYDKIYKSYIGTSYSWEIKNKYKIHSDLKKIIKRMNFYEWMLLSKPKKTYLLWNGRTLTTNIYETLIKGTASNSIFYEAGLKNHQLYFIKNMAKLSKHHHISLEKTTIINKNESIKENLPKFKSSKISSNTINALKKCDVIFFISCQDEYYSYEKVGNSKIFRSQEECILKLDKICKKLGLKLIIKLHPHLKFKSKFVLEGLNETIETLDNTCILKSNINAFKFLNPNAKVLTWVSTVGEAKYLGFSSASVAKPIFDNINDIIFRRTGKISKKTSINPQNINDVKLRE